MAGHGVDAGRETGSGKLFYMTISSKSEMVVEDGVGAGNIYFSRFRCDSSKCE